MTARRSTGKSAAARSKAERDRARAARNESRRRSSSSARQRAGAAAAVAEERSSRSARPRRPAAQRRIRPAQSAQRPPRQMTVAQRRARARRRVLLLRRIRTALLIVSLVLTGVLVWRVPQMALFNVQQVSVDGTSAVSDLLVRNRIDRLLDGQTIYTVDEDRVAREIKRLPFVRRVTIERHFPSGLSIHIDEYRPLAVAIAGNTAWLVSRDGRILVRTSLAGWRDRAPMVRLKTRKVVPGQRVAGDPGLKLLAQVPPTFPGTFRAVDSSPTAGFVARLSDGPEIRLGDATSIEHKFQVSERILTMFGPRRRERLEYVDVSIPARPSAKWRNEQ